MPHPQYSTAMEEIEGQKAIDLWAGTTLGVLEGVSLPSGEVTSYHKCLQTADKSQEVCAMCWEQAGVGQVLYCALRNGLVQRFDSEGRVFQAECDCSCGDGVFVGLGKQQEVMVTCTDRGDLCFWPPDEDKTYSHVGGGVSCMAASPDTLLQVATGGKENNLKVWDGNNPGTPVFQAKNVKNDKLDLRVPEWVKCVAYVPGAGTQPTLAVATGHHEVRLYDTRAQRRPVYSQSVDQHPFTSLTVCEDGQSVVVGSSVGDVSRCDLRKGGVLNRYTGCAGAVKGLQCFPGPDGRALLASCGLDKYLRVYTLESPKLLHKLYLKLMPSCLLYGQSLPSQVEEEREPEAKRLKEGGVITTEGAGGDDNDDDVWSKMKTVHDKSSSKHMVKGRHFI